MTERFDRLEALVEANAQAIAAYQSEEDKDWSKVLEAVRAKRRRMALMERISWVLIGLMTLGMTAIIVIEIPILMRR